MSSVSADPPMLRRSTVTVLWATAPSAVATRSAASSSVVGRCPWRTVRACPAIPYPRAMASTPAESWPADTRTPAFSLAAPRLVVPQALVHLHLEAARDPVRVDPVGQLARTHLAETRRHQH